MSLWTPGGEVPIERTPRGERPADRPAEGAAAHAGGPSLDDLSPEERAQAEAMIAQMAEVQQEIARTPAAQMVANHVMGLYELAAIKLSQQPPLFHEAQLAIDAMTAVLDGVGDRLGQDQAPLREGLRQLQMAFVQLRSEGDDTSAG